MASFVLQTLFEKIVTLKISLNLNFVLVDCSLNVGLGRTFPLFLCLFKIMTHVCEKLIFSEHLRLPDLHVN
jgi:hypothetical protein